MKLPNIFSWSRATMLVVLLALMVKFFDRRTVELVMQFLDVGFWQGVFHK